MIEFFRHSFGVCGEGHPSLFYALGLTSVIIYCKNYIRGVILSLKTLLKRSY